ncbi:MAG: glycogen/starch/alpha-glucan phosphorylase [Desulfobacca sp.]|uniref:glycogen/starch/alpha-glucan phosphorylase n=1 Tax=Desulfobacca sp. TaxID=2067990 RepID=UPI00404A0257
MDVFFDTLGLHKTALHKSIRHHLTYSLAKPWQESKSRDLYQAAALAIRDRLVERLLATEQRFLAAAAKRIYYLSIEFLIGRSLSNNLLNLGLFEVCREVFRELGADIDEIQEHEPDAGLGNGGLGRLAACFLDSLASLDLPGYGYGIHYEFGLFKQEIQNGYQREKPDNWLADGNPWEIVRPEEACLVPLYGEVVEQPDLTGNYNPMWLNWQMLFGVPIDIPVVGYGGQTVTYLRLFAARPSAEFDIQIFNTGDYFKAIEQKIFSENISKMLYPADALPAGRELRLIQEYFLVACSLRDIMRRFFKSHQDLTLLSAKVAIQLNDTHPALAVAELMRLLVDEHELPWEKAWDLTQKTLAYTNHTLLPEALETWSVNLLGRVLPRHLQIIYEINHRFLQQVAARWPGDVQRLQELSLIAEGEQKRVRMAHLAIVGSHSCNGVSALHTELLRRDMFPGFNALWPERFNNKTNGVTPRRWLLKANPWLAALITHTIGTDWIKDLERLRALEAYASDASFQEQFAAAKKANKERLASLIRETVHLTVNTDSLFDIQAKRIHEYKRQLLKVMHIIHTYFCLLEGQEPLVPRTFIFAGKAAPGYWAAKQIIKLIHNVGKVINADPRVRDFIKVVFIPDYRVSLAEVIIPAADLSEQISTAGFEASGTGNMKFALNGALTIGTMDGANIEILEEVGRDNIFIFGLTAAEVAQSRQTHSYRPQDYYDQHPEIRRILDAWQQDTFCPGEPGLWQWLFETLLHRGDPYFHLADFMDYLRAQAEADTVYHQPSEWCRRAILNVARIGKFSSDRTILEYLRDIWHKYL